MKTVKQIVNTSFLNFRRWRRNPRIIVLAILSFIWIHRLMSPIKDFARLVQVNVSAWGFPFLTADWYPHMVFLLEAVLLFSDAPFIHHNTTYELIRCGKKRWMTAHIMYILLSSLIFVLYLVISSIACVFPNVSFQHEWGRVYLTLSQTNAASYSIFPVSYGIQQEFSATTAMVFSSLLLWLEFSLIGETMFFLSLIISKRLGTFVGIVLSFFPALSSIVGKPAIYYFLPTTWAGLNNIQVSDSSLQYPSLSFALSILVLLDTIIGLSIIYKKKTRINL